MSSRATITAGLACELISVWLLFGLALVYGNESSKLEMNVIPHVCQAPCDISVDLRILPRKENRWLTVELDGTMFRSSAYTLDGENTPIRHIVQFKSAPAGDYNITATVYGDSRAEFTKIRQALTVR